MFIIRKIPRASHPHGNIPNDAPNYKCRAVRTGLRFGSPGRSSCSTPLPPSHECLVCQRALLSFLDRFPPAVSAIDYYDR